MPLTAFSLSFIISLISLVSFLLHTFDQTS